MIRTFIAFLLIATALIGNISQTKGSITPIPTAIPTATPSTAIPTALPTDVPTDVPTEIPTAVPTVEPTAPTGQPTSSPSSQPTSQPSNLIQNEALVDEFTTDLLTATLSGSISAVEQVINTQGLGEATKNNQAYTSLVSSIFHGRSSQAEVILTKTEMDINAVGETGNTALMFASMWDQLDSVRFLLEAGADTTIENTDGDNAVALALKGGHRAVVRLLREYGAV